MIPKSQRTPTSAAPGGTLGSVGPYQLIEQLPGSREVRQYLARQRGPGGFERICALKLAPRNIPDPRPAESLEREAKIVMRLDHPNIVRFLDLFEHEGDVVLVLEHFSGLTLARLIELLREQSPNFDERIVWHVGLCLFEALAHAHGLVDDAGEPAPTVHRDVRPGNILLASDGRVRLTGFSAAQGSQHDEEITAFGAVFAVPSYVAPEQARGGDVTERADAFAAALVLWELLAGRSATPEGLTEFELLKHLAKRRMDPLRVLRPDIPALVTTALDLCLAHDPHDRRIRCEEVAGCIASGLDMGDGASALRDAIASLGPAVEKLAGGKANAPASRRPQSVHPLPHRPEAITVPDRGEARPDTATVVPSVSSSPDVPDVTAEVFAASNPPKLSPSRIAPPVPSSPAPSSPAPSSPAPSSPAPSSPAPSSPAPSSPAPSSPAPSSPAPSSPAPSSPAPSSTALSSAVTTPLTTDDDLHRIRAAQSRRRVVRAAVIGVPVLATVIVLAVARLGSVGGSDAPALPAASAPLRITTVTPASTQVPSAAREEPGMDTIPHDQAVLIVKSPPRGDVYVMGKAIGRTDERIVTECGQRFVRVGQGAEGVSSIRWLAEGQSVGLRCGKATVVPANPDRIR